MASKLSLYNAALAHVGERRLTSASENRPGRRRLDAVWDGDEGVLFLLSQGLWNFAMRTVKLTYDPSVEPQFGYTRAFTKPDDWVRTAMVSDDESFANRDCDYIDENDHWQAHTDDLYVKHVSSDVLFGRDLSLWTPAFSAYASAHFAAKICKATTGSDEETAALIAMATKKLRVARSQDAMNEAILRPPRGSWSTARQGSSSRSDRGNRGRLIG